LELPSAEAIHGRRDMTAAILVNLASLLVEMTDLDAAREARCVALRALSHIDTCRSEQDPNVAEIAIKARYALCRALAASSADEQADESVDDTLHLLTDAVDEGLALARLWEQKGVDRFRALAIDLLRFGIRVYAKYQPHFLNEFVAENLDPALSSGAYVGSAGARDARLEALWLSFRRPLGDER
jgi:hypothetical protein